MQRDYRLPGHVFFNEGFCGCEDRCAILESKLMGKDFANDPEVEELKVEDIPFASSDDCCSLDESDNNAYVYVDNGGKPAKIKLSRFMYPNHIIPDWEAKLDEYGNMPLDFIQNKPSMKVNEIVDSEGQPIFPEGFMSEVSYGDIFEGDWVDGDMTAIDILKKMMTKTQRVPLIYGCSTELPIAFQEGVEEYKVDKKYPTRDELIKKGAIINFHGLLDSEGYHGYYFFIGIPRGFDLVCNGIMQGGHFIEFGEGWIKEEESYDYVVGGTNYRYDFYRLLYPVVGRFTVRFAFMDAFDPRVHPDLRHPGRKISLVDLWRLLHQAFQLDSEGNILLDSEGNPTLREEVVPINEMMNEYLLKQDYEEALEVVKSQFELDSEGEIVTSEGLFIPKLATKIDNKFTPFIEKVDKFLPDSFGSGGDAPLPPGPGVPVGDYVLVAHVADSTGNVTYEWKRILKEGIV